MPTLMLADDLFIIPSLHLPRVAAHSALSSNRSPLNPTPDLPPHSTGLRPCGPGVPKAFGKTQAPGCQATPDPTSWPASPLPALHAALPHSSRFPGSQASLLPQYSRPGMQQRAVSAAQ